MGIVEYLFSRKGSNKEQATVATMPCQPAAPKLMMLMPDASGIASYQLHTFAAASEAEAYLVSILRGDIQEGTIMFWALTWRPSDTGSRAVEAEPVVLIRDPGRPGLVYTFSFVDLDSAYDFVRGEVKAGLDLAQTAIFWAVPAEATADHWGEITVTPNRPPTREPAPNGGAPLPAPTPFVAPDHDEPKGTQQHIDETSSVRLPELLSDEPEAADEPETVGEPEAVSEPEVIDEPETVSEQEAAEEPAHKAVDEADISNVIGILQARGLRALSSQPQPIDEAEAPEDSAETTDQPSHAGHDTAHIDLSDVFGGRRDSEPAATLSDFRRSREGLESNGVDAPPDDAVEAPTETVSGVVAAWSNISAAIDGAIDAHVSRRVSATIAWRRLSRAFAAAASARLLQIWRRLAQAFYAGAAVQAARERALALAWNNAARAFRQAAESMSGRRALRLAWANISWTLEEAVYAAGLQQKKAAARAWSTASSAVADAAVRQNAIDRGVRTAWDRLALASLDAAKAGEARRARVAFAWVSTGIALNEYVTTKLHHDGLVAAWTRLAAAFEEAAAASARREGLIRAWRYLTRAFTAAANVRMLVTWRAISRALFAGAAVQAARERALALAWNNAARAFRQAAESMSGRRALRLAWANISWTLEEAVYAARLQQKKAAARAWSTASSALAIAVRKKDAVDRGLATAWTRLAAAMERAAAESIRRDGLSSAWRAVSLEMLVAADMQAEHRKRAAVRAWSNAMLALTEATVAEAQIRIAQAGLDDRTMKGVNAAIRKTQGRKVASAARKAADQAVKVAPGVTVNSASAKGSTNVKGAAKTTEATKTAKPQNGRGKTKAAAKPVAEKRLAADEQATAMDTWRARESGRFSEKKGPFSSFDSPPGRF